MKIEYLGHSSFKISGDKVSLITDPFDKYVGFSMPKATADIVTVSHGHDDHNSVKDVDGKFLVLDKEGTYETDGLTVTSFLTNHDHHEGKKRGKNLIFTYDFNGTKICHMGDIGQPCTPQIADKIGNVNVLLIPVGGHFTVSPEEAFEYVTVLKPNLVIPMHFKAKENDWPIVGVEEFLSFFDEKDVVFVGDSTLELTDDMIHGKTKIYVMERSKK